MVFVVKTTASSHCPSLIETSDFVNLLHLTFRMNWKRKSVNKNNKTEQNNENRIPYLDYLSGLIWPPQW